MSWMSSNFQVDKKTGRAKVQVDLDSEMAFALVKFASEEGITPSEYCKQVLRDHLMMAASEHMEQIKREEDRKL